MLRKDYERKSIETRKEYESDTEPLTAEDIELCNYNYVVQFANGASITFPSINVFRIEEEDSYLRIEEKGGWHIFPWNNIIEIYTERN